MKKPKSPRKSKTVFPVVVAVHLISESYDHYTWCLTATSVEQFVNDIKNECVDFSHCDNPYLAGLDGADVSELSSALSEAIEAAREEKEREHEEAE